MFLQQPIDRTGGDLNADGLKGHPIKRATGCSYDQAEKWQ